MESSVSFLPLDAKRNHRKITRKGWFAIESIGTRKGCTVSDFAYNLYNKVHLLLSLWTAVGELTYYNVTDVTSFG